MKILVTGASGFIGSHIMNCLKTKGYEIIGCGRSHMKQKDVKYVKCDLTQKMPDWDTDVIVHAAGLNPSEYNTFNDYFDNNIIATNNIIKYAHIHQVKKIIYIGTLASYGTVEQVLKEESLHNNPGEYGLTKYVAEQLIKHSGIPYYILLPATVIGKGCGNNWIMRTAKALSKNQKVTYYNGTGLFNNIVEIEDMCMFILKLLERQSGGSETYLLGSDEMTTVENIVMSLKERLSSASQIYPALEKKNQFYLDVKKALDAGFCPRPIEDILAEICVEIKEQL